MFATCYRNLKKMIQKCVTKNNYMCNCIVSVKKKMLKMTYYLAFHITINGIIAALKSDRPYI